jgi:hypothetical protein
MRRTIGVDLASDERLGKVLVATGGVFAPGASGMLAEECNLVLHAGHEELHLVARIVLLQDGGVGLEIVERTSELREQIATFARIAEYIATSREGRSAAVAPALPPAQPATESAGKGVMLARVRVGSIAQEPAAIPRTRTLTGPLGAAEARRRPAGSMPPQAVVSRRVGNGSMPPQTEQVAAPRVTAAHQPEPPDATLAADRRDIDSGEAELASGHSDSEDR